MKLSELKALVIDDSVYKAMDITRALGNCGIQDVVRARNQEAGFELLYENQAAGTPIGLIVTDMHYPLDAGMEADYDAGFKLIDRLRAERIKTPVIICSSRNFVEPGILGNVWYSAQRDLGRDFQEVLERLKI